ncbi:hypothetical protein ACCO45_006363 [Purpureocillium lilacinum]|uniref:Uncharacterized protein n=1 Tax=Purpureocillium lilacinum TaxID=33203 RepID=A0ACC4DP97_PURLI
MRLRVAPRRAAHSAPGGELQARALQAGREGWTELPEKQLLATGVRFERPETLVREWRARPSAPCLLLLEKFLQLVLLVSGGEPGSSPLPGHREPTLARLARPLSSTARGRGRVREGSFACKRKRVALAGGARGEEPSWLWSLDIDNAAGGVDVGTGSSHAWEARVRPQGPARTGKEGQEPADGDSNSAQTSERWGSGRFVYNDAELPLRLCAASCLPIVRPLLLVASR